MQNPQEVLLFPNVFQHQWGFIVGLVMVYEPSDDIKFLHRSQPWGSSLQYSDYAEVYLKYLVVTSVNTYFVQ